MRELLFLSHRIPYPPNKGDKIRSWHMLQKLAAEWQVHLGCFVDDPADLQHRQKLEDICASVHLAPLNPRLAKLASLSGLLLGEPLTMRYFQSARMADWIDSVAPRAEAAFAFSSAMAPMLFTPSLHHARKIVDMVDVDSEKWRDMGQRTRGPMGLIYRREAEKLLAAERDIAARADATLFVSEAEAELFRSRAPDSAAKIMAIDNGVDSEFFSPLRPWPSPFGTDEMPILFTGMMDYWPNIDAVRWFARDILPQIREECPMARFWIVGAKPVDEVQALADLPGVVVTGRVEDVRPYLAHAALSVAPLRLARGIQNKVLEAMAMQRAIVATPDAAAGLAVQPQRHLAVAGNAGDFAQSCLALLTGPDSDRRNLGKTARELVIERFAWASVLRPFGQLFQDGTVIRSVA